MILNVFFLQVVAVKGCRAVTVDIPTEVLFFSAKIRCRKAWVLNQSWASCRFPTNSIFFSPVKNIRKKETMIKRNKRNKHTMIIMSKGQ